MYKRRGKMEREVSYPVGLDFETKLFRYEIEWKNEQLLAIVAIQKSEEHKRYFGLVEGSAKKDGL
jgi:hypothetical protein